MGRKKSLKILNTPKKQEQRLKLHNPFIFKIWKWEGIEKGNRSLNIEIHYLKGIALNSTLAVLVLAGKSACGSTECKLPSWAVEITFPSNAHQIYTDLHTNRVWVSCALPGQGRQIFTVIAMWAEICIPFLLQLLVTTLHDFRARPSSHCSLPFALVASELGQP